MPDRELIDTGNDKRYVRRDEDGQFNESDDVGKRPRRTRSATPTATPRVGRATAATAKPADR